jgi:hypothetical protein
MKQMGWLKQRTTAYNESKEWLVDLGMGAGSKMQSCFILGT